MWSRQKQNTSSNIRRFFFKNVQIPCKVRIIRDFREQWNSYFFYWEFFLKKIEYLFYRWFLGNVCFRIVGFVSMNLREWGMKNDECWSQYFMKNFLKKFKHAKFWGKCFTVPMNSQWRVRSRLYNAPKSHMLVEGDEETQAWICRGDAGGV